MNTSRAKRLLILVPGIPRQSRGASSVLFYHYIDHLRASGLEILNVLLLQSQDIDENALRDYARAMVQPGRFEVIPCRVDGAIAKRPLSITFGPAPLRPVLESVRSFRPDAIVAFDLLSAWAAKHVSAATRLVWLGDLNFRTHWCHAVYSVRETPTNAIHLPGNWHHSLLWKRVYRKVLGDVDRVIVSSKSSEADLERLGIASVYYPYPWPSEERAADTSVPRRSSIPQFLFFGNLVGLGSRSAFHFLFQKLYPRLLDCWGAAGFQILIAGRETLPSFAHREISRKPEFSYLGFVENLRHLMLSSTAVIAPMDVPVGNRSRIVTAMANGALVIAHRNVALGNPALVHGDTCFLADTADSFASSMKRAFEHPDEAQLIVARARMAYDTQFRPDIAAEYLVSELRTLLMSTKLAGANRGT